MLENFDARRRALILAGFTRNHPHARLETISGMSLDLRQRLDAGDIDIALIKREPDSGPAWATWPERLVWVKGADFDSSSGVLPLALFPQGCLYRQRAIRLLDVAQRPWRVAFGRHSLTGIQAAVASGFGVRCCRLRRYCRSIKCVRTCLNWRRRSWRWSAVKGF
ncbi:LysR substrate-binding domain-containing protein [Pseudomonas sp. DTU12.3]|uniref:LysR substrate-binding domain-containing protein n=1 Tax=Pseudomonas sp. DTU12.3 TaxID=2073078 RepID=UPI0021140B87